MTCAYGWAVSATAARTTKASLPKSGAQPGTKDIDREARESRGPTPRILAAAAAPPCGYDQGLDQRPHTRAARRLMLGFSIRPDASSSKRASCVTAGPRSATLSAHVRYLKRNGVTRTGEAARMFTRETDLADERAFASVAGMTDTIFDLS
jgi:hypothetical protein